MLTTCFASDITQHSIKLNLSDASMDSLSDIILENNYCNK